MEVAGGGGEPNWSPSEKDREPIHYLENWVNERN